MNTSFAIRFAAPAGLVAAASLAGCTMFGEGLLSGDKVDYRGATVSAKPLEVPPDLTQLARESRYQPQGGVVSASTVAAGPAVATPAAVSATAAAAGPATVALSSQGAVRIERAGQQRWLVVSQTPEQLWPQVKTFWEELGFTLDVADAQLGIMETNWSENRAKLPNDAIRNTIGRLVKNLYDTGERDRFRTRIERAAGGGSEIYITHRGAEEAWADQRKETTSWRARDNDPQLEAEFLSRLMVKLGGGSTEQARGAITAAATTTGPVAGMAAPVRTTPGNTATSMVVDEPFDRAWRRVGLALDRGGFTVEDRDRAAGLYYVRYVDPKSVGKEEPGWWSRLFGNKANPAAAQRLRIAVKGTGDKTTVSVQKATGEPDLGENAQRIVGLLMGELR
ncbi:MAG TPA: outer membrane protein assembly factor BamC [Rubrivivax sp.]|nr:outer membrane protein assembly factor BamC [Rubrivivax sp.]